MKLSKYESRIRRALRTRYTIERGQRNRISIHRSGKHIYVQLIDATNNVLTSSSTVDKELRKTLKNTSSIDSARKVGEHFAEKIKKASLAGPFAFDRSGFSFHGRVKALAEGIRSNGIEV